MEKYLCYEQRFIDPNYGLWLFSDLESAYCGQASCIPNCVALHIGETDYSVLAKCGEFIKQFPFMLITDPTIAQTVREHVQNIPLLVANTDKPVKEIYAKQDMSGVEGLLKGAKELPAYGILNIADVTPIDVAHMPRVLSGIGDLDYHTGGFLMGDVSVWTGKRGDGKSTLLSQILIEAVDRGKKVCAYSGELSAPRFKNWMYLQAAGAKHITEDVDKEIVRIMYEVEKEAMKKLDKWFDNRLFVYDLTIGSAHDVESILAIFEYAARRYGCSVFLVDNIMTARFKGTSDENFYREQSNFVGRLVEFAIRFNAHVHVVAHPKKGEIKDSDAVSGTSDITNRPGNIFSLSRLSESESREKGFDSVLAILKNRAYGDLARIGLTFDTKSRRFYKSGTGNPKKKYGWELL